MADLAHALNACYTPSIDVKETFMIFVKTFKGYEDKTAELDAAVNGWILKNKADVVTVSAVLSHEHAGRAGSGDLIYTVLYRSDVTLP